MGVQVLFRGIFNEPAKEAGSNLQPRSFINTEEDFPRLRSLFMQKTAAECARRCGRAVSLWLQGCRRFEAQLTACRAVGKRVFAGGEASKGGQLVRSAL